MVPTCEGHNNDGDENGNDDDVDDDDGDDDVDDDDDDDDDYDDGDDVMMKDDEEMFLCGSHSWCGVWGVRWVVRDSIDFRSFYLISYIFFACRILGVGCGVGRPGFH